MAKLSQIAPELPVANLSEAIEYYKVKLGFELIMQTDGGDYAVVERDDVAIHLFHDDARTYPPAGVHIFTHELDELHSELQKRGAALSQDIVLKPWGNRDFRVKDPSGNDIKFTELL